MPFAAQPAEFVPGTCTPRRKSSRKRRSAERDFLPPPGSAGVGPEELDLAVQFRPLVLLRGDGDQLDEQIRHLPGSARKSYGERHGRPTSW